MSEHKSKLETATTATNYGTHERIVTPCDNLTQVGLLEQIMAWPINETNVRQELPKWESAIQKFENRSGPVLSDTLKIGFLRKNLGPTIKNHLRLSSHLLTNYNQVRELIIEWNRFGDFDKARGGQLAMDIGWVGN